MDVINSTSLFIVFGILYIPIVLLLWFIDCFKWGNSTHKGTESFYTWYWDKTYHTLYINKELNNFYLQHYIKETTWGKEEPNEYFKVLREIDIRKKPPVSNVQPPPNKQAEVHELMNKVKGEL